MRIRLGLLALALAAVTAQSTAARAAGGEEDSLNRDADARFQEGVTLAKAGNYEDARTKFVQAYALDPNVRVLLNLAIAEKNSGHPVEALRHLRAYCKDPRSNADKVKGVQRDLLPPLVAATGHVDVTAPSGASVVVDQSDSVGTAPLDTVVDVTPGRHWIEARVGDKGSRKQVDVAAGATQKVELTVDGASSAAAGSGAPPAAGDHHVEPPPVAESHTTMWPPPVGAMILGGVGLVGIGVGVGFGLDSKSKADDASTLEAAHPCAQPTSAACSALKDKNDSSKTSGAIAVVGYGVGGAALVGGLVWWMVAPRKTTAPAMGGVAPMMGPGVAGLRVQREF